MKHFSFSVSEVLFFILIFAITIPGNVIAEQDLSEGVGNFNQLSDEHKVKGQTLEDLSFQNSWKEYRGKSPSSNDSKVDSKTHNAKTESAKTESPKKKCSFKVSKCGKECVEMNCSNGKRIVVHPKDDGSWADDGILGVLHSHWKSVDAAGNSYCECK